MVTLNNKKGAEMGNYKADAIPAKVAEKAEKYGWTKTEWIRKEYTVEENNARMAADAKAYDEHLKAEAEGRKNDTDGRGN